MWKRNRHTNFTMVTIGTMRNNDKQFDEGKYNTNRLQTQQNNTYSFSSGLAGDGVLSFSCSFRKIVTRATVCFVFSDSNEIFH